MNSYKERVIKELRRKVAIKMCLLTDKLQKLNMPIEDDFMCKEGIKEILEEHIEEIVKGGPSTIRKFFSKEQMDFITENIKNQKNIKQIGAYMDLMASYVTITSDISNASNKKAEITGDSVLDIMSVVSEFVDRIQKLRNDDPDKITIDETTLIELLLVANSMVSSQTMLELIENEDADCDSCDNRKNCEAQMKGIIDDISDEDETVNQNVEEKRKDDLGPGYEVLYEKSNFKPCSKCGNLTHYINTETGRRECLTCFNKAKDMEEK